MKEEFILKAKIDSRVKYEKLNGIINLFSAKPVKRAQKVVIYTHGMGSNKDWVTRFYAPLVNKNIAVYAFDLPSHGEDESDFALFTLDLCVFYLENVIKYVKKMHPGAKICLFGSSFGAFVILNKLLKEKNGIDKTVLMCPAFNLTDLFARKTGGNTDYFSDQDYVQVFENMRIYKEAYPGLKNGNDLIKKSKFENIAVIEGNKDKATPLEDVKWFCDKNSLPLKVIENGYHELYNFEPEIVDFILEKIN